jgi:hypothetical protein
MKHNFNFCRPTNLMLQVPRVLLTTTSALGANPSLTTTPGQPRDDEDCVRFLSPSVPQPGIENSPSPSAFRANGLSGVSTQPISASQQSIASEPQISQTSSPNLILAGIERRVSHTAAQRPTSARRVSNGGSYSTFSPSPRSKPSRAMLDEPSRPTAPTPNRASAASATSLRSPMGRPGSLLADAGDDGPGEERKSNVGVGVGFEVNEAGEAVVDAIVRGGPADLSGQVACL